MTPAHRDDQISFPSDLLSDIQMSAIDLCKQYLLSVTTPSVLPANVKPQRYSEQMET